MLNWLRALGHSQRAHSPNAADSVDDIHDAADE